MGLNQEALRAVHSSSFGSCFRKPLYDSFSFSRIPATVSYLLSGEDSDQALPSSCYQGGHCDGVLLLFLDALGWVFFEQFCNAHPFFRRFLQEGIASPISVQFPSTTAAHVTTIHTGLEVGQTGIYEWFQYEPLVDSIIAPLLFAKAGDVIENSLLSTPHDPHHFFPFSSLYEEFHKKGIESYVLQPAKLNTSPYSQVLCQGAHQIGFLHLAQGIQTAKELFARGSSLKKKTYALLYYDSIDAMGHRKGVSSSHFAKAIKHCLDVLEQELMTNFPKNTALIVTADHGMVGVRPKSVLYVNVLCPELESWIKTNAKGEPLVPAGSCRDLFLHCKDPFLDRAQKELQNQLQGKAEVWKVEDLIKEGFFGQKEVSKRFMERVGNLVILPYKGEAVWWFFPHKFEQNFFGAHGGLSPEEMDSSFLFLK